MEVKNQKQVLKHMLSLFLFKEMNKIEDLRGCRILCGPGTSIQLDFD